MPLKHLAPAVAFPAATGATVTLGSRLPEPLVGAERDEIEALVRRLKQADARQRTPLKSAPRPSVKALEWAEEWKLPREVHEYFELETA